MRLSTAPIPEEIHPAKNWHASCFLCAYRPHGRLAGRFPILSTAALRRHNSVAATSGASVAILQSNATSSAIWSTVIDRVWRVGETERRLTWPLLSKRAVRSAEAINSIGCFLLESDTDLNCIDCGYVSTAKRAIDAGRTASSTESGSRDKSLGNVRSR
jgi:hypothetical protein